MTTNRTKIRTYTIGGEKWSVFECDKDDSILDESWGITYFEPHCIYLQRDLNKRFKRKTLTHELMHACLHESGWDDAIRTKLEDCYESFVDGLSKRINDLIEEERKK